MFAPERLLCSRPSSEVLIGKPGGVLFESGIVHNKWNAPVTSVRQTSTATVILVTSTLTVILVTSTLTVILVTPTLTVILVTPAVILVTPALTVILVTPTLTASPRKKDAAELQTCTCPMGKTITG